MHDERLENLYHKHLSMNCHHITTMDNYIIQLKEEKALALQDYSQHIQLLLAHGYSQARNLVHLEQNKLITVINLNA